MGDHQCPGLIHACQEHAGRWTVVAMFAGWTIGGLFAWLIGPAWIAVLVGLCCFGINAWLLWHHSLQQDGHEAFVECDD